MKVLKHPWAFALFAGICAAIAIGILASSPKLDPQWILLMAPFGASAVILFGLPDSPLAQPKNVIFGHMITATAGLCFLQWFGVQPWSLAAACGLSVTLMLLTKTTHPPAGANPLLIMLTGEHWPFLITTVLAGAVVMVLVAQLAKRLNRRFLRVQ